MTKFIQDIANRKVLLSPLMIITAMVVIAGLTSFLGLNIKEFNFLIENFRLIAQIVLAFIILKLVLYYVDIWLLNARKNENINDNIIIYIRYSIYVIFSVAALESFGYDLTSVLAFGGIGGLVLGFAAKDMISNVFGYLTIKMDTPFRVGDLISCEQAKVNGTVLAIGFRTTKVMGLDKRPIYIPNSVWTTATIINSSRRTHRELSVKIPLLKYNAENVSIALKQINSILNGIDDIDENKGLYVYLADIDNYGAQIKVLAFTRPIALNEFYKIKSKFNLEIISILSSNNIEINHSNPK